MKKGWPTKTLAEVCQIKPPKSEARDKVSASSLVSFLPMEDMGIDVKFVQATQTKPLSAVVGSYTYFADGDVLLAKITPCFENGKLGIADGLKNGIGFGSSEYFVFRPDQTVSKEWLYYFLSRETFRVEGAARMTGAVGHKRVAKEFIEEYPIPVPPLAEQQRIVGLLDEAFEDLATAKANAEKNLQNARALFESHLQSVFTQRGPGWVEKRLDAVAKFSQGIQVGLGDQANAPAKSLVRFIRIIDYTQGTDDIRYVQDPGRRYWADKSDIVMVRYGTPGLVGRGIEGVIANNLFKISILDGALTKDFLAYFLGQQTVQTFLSSQGSSTMPALTFTQLGAVVVSFPRELEIQNTIVSKLDDLREETQRLARLYERKHAALEALKKSLLHQAFTGQL